jgi:hypothetical protein
MWEELHVRVEKAGIWHRAGRFPEFCAYVISSRTRKYWIMVVATQ